MAQLFEFISNHLLLCGAFVMLLVLLFGNELRTRLYGVNKTSVQGAVALQGRNAALIVDVRDDDAYADGHILGAKHISYEQLKAEQAKSLTKHKDKPVILVCDNGLYSTRVGSWLKQHGFADVTVLEGGMQGWRQANLPVRRPKAKSTVEKGQAA